ncbi:unnamed protein product [Adineta steineri]|uniref:Uncharacterized protein n=1 Tax=Adineta steineri TaxID=433720 RepID=A0A814YWW7_9BILA|nr:unnamed protein product [Adineta steineri]CAF3653529.1 unnamed protein product [Adineta steineri]
MSFIWDAKNNFILLHFITLHEQQSHINWSSIVNDISLEICSTSTLLKIQYEYLLENYCPKQDSKCLYKILKDTYLHSLCQKVEDDSKLSLEIVYELVRHARSKRINVNDIEQLIKEWDFNYASEEQKKTKEHLFDVLNRLRDYIQNLPKTENSSTNISQMNQKKKQDEDLEPVSDTDDEMPVIHETNEVIININDDDQMILNRIKQEKSTITRRRTRSLTIFTGNQDNKINIGVEWFVPKLKRQQRSSSLHAPLQSPPAQDHNLESTEIFMTILDNDESSNSTNSSNIRHTHTQPTISWLPLTNEQIAKKEEDQQQQTKSKLIDDEQLDQVSSTDSEPMEIQLS